MRTKTSGLHGSHLAASHRLLFHQKYENPLLLLRGGQRPLHRWPRHHFDFFVPGAGLNILFFTFRLRNGMVATRL